MNIPDKIKKFYKKDIDYYRFKCFVNDIYENYKNTYSYIEITDDKWNQVILDSINKHYKNKEYKEKITGDLNEFLRNYHLKAFQELDQKFFYKMFYQALKNSSNFKSLFRNFYGMFINIDIELTKEYLKILIKLIPNFKKLIYDLGLQDFNYQEIHFYYNDGFTYWEKLKTNDKSLRWVMNKFDLILYFIERPINLTYITEKDEKNIDYITIKYILRNYNKFNDIYSLYCKLIEYIEINDFYYIIFNCNLEELKKIILNFNYFKSNQNKNFLYIIASKIATKKRALNDKKVYNLKDKNIYKYFLGKECLNKDKQIIIDYLLNRLSYLEYSEVLKVIAGSKGKGQDFIGRITSDYLNYLLKGEIKKNNYISDLITNCDVIKTYSEELDKIPTIKYMIYENKLKKIERKFLKTHTESYNLYFSTTMAKIINKPHPWTLEKLLTCYINIASCNLEETPKPRR